MPEAKVRPYRTQVARRILTLQLPPTTTAFHAHARLVLMAYLYLPHEFVRPRLSHNVRKIAAYTGLHTETVKRTRKRLVDLGILVKVGKRAGKNGLMRDVLTWGPVLFEEQSQAARSNEQPLTACSNGQPAVAEPAALAADPCISGQPPAASVDEQPAVAVSVDGPPLVARQMEQPPNASVDGSLTVARRTRRPRVAPAIEPAPAPASAAGLAQMDALTPEEKDGLGSLHQFVRRVADSRNAPGRILRALQPILDANDPEAVWDLVLRRNPYEAEDLALLRQTESLWRSRRPSPRVMNPPPSHVV